MLRLTSEKSQTACVHSRRDPGQMGKLRPHMEKQVVFPSFGWLLLTELSEVLSYYKPSFHKLLNT